MGGVRARDRIYDRIIQKIIRNSFVFYCCFIDILCDISCFARVADLQNLLTGFARV